MLDDYFLKQKKIYCKDTKETCTGYIEYLQSEHWKRKRAERITPETVCEKCGKRGILQLHHLTYTRVGNERKGDLQVLCVDCHKKAHEIKAEKKARQAKHRKAKKLKKQKCDKYGMPIKKEISPNKEIKNARRKIYDHSCEHCMTTKNDGFSWCEFEYRYCPFKKCGDYKEKKKPD